MIADGRRLEALQWSCEKHGMPLDALIECKVFASERAVAVSLTENIGQKAMHPADHLVA